MHRFTRLTSPLSLLLVMALIAGCSSSGGTAQPGGKRTSKQLGMAARSGGPAELEAALATGENINGPGDSKNTPLHEAALFDNVEAAKWLVEHGANVNSVDEDDDTPLHFAADKGSPKVARFLLQSGATVDALNEDGETPLFLAAESGSAELAEILINAGADPNKRNSDGESALMIAREEGHGAVIPILERGRKPAP